MQIIPHKTIRANPPPAIPPPGWRTFSGPHSCRLGDLLCDVTGRRWYFLAVNHERAIDAVRPGAVSILIPAFVTGWRPCPDGEAGFQLQAGALREVARVLGFAVTDYEWVHCPYGEEFFARSPLLNRDGSRDEYGCWIAAGDMERVRELVEGRG